MKKFIARELLVFIAAVMLVFLEIILGDDVLNLIPIDSSLKVGVIIVLPCYLGYWAIRGIVWAVKILRENPNPKPKI